MENESIKVAANKIIPNGSQKQITTGLTVENFSSNEKPSMA